MFLAVRDINHAHGRFTLMTGVIALITLLLVMLTGLTGGLGKQNTSALEALAPEAVVFSGEEPSFTDSAMRATDIAAHPDTTPLGVGQTRVELGEKAASTGIFGLPADEAIPAAVVAGAGDVDAAGVVLPATLAEVLGAGVGDTVAVAGMDMEVTGIVTDTFYSHTPVAWMSLDTWAQVTHAPRGVEATVLLGHDAAGGDIPGAQTLTGSFAGLASYNSERGSLVTMQGFLYAISALITVAFLTVWTIQRTRDLSIVRALGASGRYLLKDALGQAAIVLSIGVVAGGLIGLGLGWLATGVLPFDLSALTVAGPMVGIWALGMVGAVLATRRVRKTDPMLALGGNG